MPMGIVSDSEFEKEIKHNTNTPKKPEVREAEVVDIERGRPKGSVEVPNTLRNLIGLENLTEGRAEALELGRQFGVSPSSVSAYMKGATSTATYNERPNEPVINKTKDNITKKASKRLMMALDEITPAKLSEAKPRELAGIARDMSAIVREMEPDNKRDKDDGGILKPAFIVYSPQIRQENHYETIVVKE